MSLLYSKLLDGWSCAFKPSGPLRSRYFNVETIYNVNLMWDKAYFLALILIGCHLGAGLLIGLLGAMFNTNSRGLSLIVQFVSAYTVGQLYAQKQQNVMPQSLRLQASIYSILLSLCLTAVVLLAMNALELLGLLPILGGVGLLAVIGLILTYWGLGSGSKAYLKKTKK
ncbi:hypothetical protein H6F76_23380 [Leptolyngbya sp. FACHB-321]|uniref:ABZJ_00895 family protein n=1 Tax=Leptolyngbya sp. FACHB-321 TaxID=2692807 RepID=UPI001688E37C|nr:ABZJ_00895 family protein [Leptolyngbya sp. FACHB-321]MBD2037900.1 hypothetical protein [Leptolyngbya sp. FACHB-321]